MNSPIMENDVVIQDNLGLVHSCAHKFKGRGIEYDDLFQAGCIGLIKAKRAFDTSRGVKFSTYAVPVILGEMRRMFRDGGAIKVSRGLKELSLKVARERDRFCAKHGRDATVNEIAELLGVGPDEIVEAIEVYTPPMSLTWNDEDGESQLDIPVDSQEEEIGDIISLKEVVDKLSENDRDIILLRYFKGKTQTQIAETLGMTQVQVSRREKKILLQLRELLTG